MVSSLNACRAVLGQELDAESVAAALRDPIVFVDRVMEARATTPNNRDRLPPLESGELRPLLWDWNYSAIWSLRYAEAGLDKLTAALLHAHRAVVVDPFDHLAQVRRRDGTTPEDLRATLSSTLHYLAWIQPLHDHETVLLHPADTERAKRWVAGPWPRMRRRSTTPNPLWVGLDRLMGMDRAEREMRYAVQAEWRAGVSNMIRDRLVVLNQLEGRAHFYAAFHPTINDYDVWWDERSISDTVYNRALVLRLVTGLRVRRMAAQRPSHDERRLAFLLRAPVPDLSIATASDLVGIRESGSFGLWRHRLAGHIDAYESAAANGEYSVGADIADALRDEARELEDKAGRDSALTALRGGAATLAVSVAGALAAAPLIGLSNVGIELTVVASTALLETLRRLRAARHEASGRAYVLARASVARAAAERFDNLS